MSEWCEHIQKSIAVNDDSLYFVPSGKTWCEVGYDKRWKFCPICGAKRPKVEFTHEQIKAVKELVDMIDKDDFILNELKRRLGELL